MCVCVRQVGGVGRVRGTGGGGPAVRRAGLEGGAAAPPVPPGVRLHPALRLRFLIQTDKGASVSSPRSAVIYIAHELAPISFLIRPSFSKQISSVSFRTLSYFG